jgi:hypothetical protein
MQTILPAIAVSHAIAGTYGIPLVGPRRPAPCPPGLGRQPSARTAVSMPAVSETDEWTATAVRAAAIAPLTAERN